MSETPVITFEATASFSAFFTADFPIFLTPCQAALLQTDVPVSAAPAPLAHPMRVVVVGSSSASPTSYSETLLSHAALSFAQHAPSCPNPAGQLYQHTGPTPE